MKSLRARRLIAVVLLAVVYGTAVVYGIGAVVLAVIN